MVTSPGCPHFKREETARSVLILSCSGFFALVADPLNLAAVLPLALLLDTLFTDVGADSVLLSGLPLADVLAAISPNEGTVALAFIIYEVTLVHFAVLPF
jgi:hypothetical protein